MGIEHRQRGEAVDQEWIASTTKGCKIPAADARGTAEVEDGKHISGGVVIGVKNEVASVVDTTGSKVESFQDKRRNNYTLVGELQRWIPQFCGMFLAFGRLDC